MVLIGARASTAIRTKHCHGCDTPRIKKMHEKIGCQQSQGWCGCTIRPLAPPGAPPSQKFHLGAHAYVGILVMLVSDLYSAGSQRDRAKMHLIMLNQENIHIANFT